MDIDTFGLGHGLLFRRAVFGKAGVEKTQHRNVEPVEPDHRRIGLHLADMAVVMPGPARRDDEVAGFHLRALAVYCRERAVPLNDEAQRALRMAVAGRDFARHDDLQARIERLRDARLPAQPGVFQNQHPPHGFFGRDQPARLHQVGMHVSVLPQCRMAGRGGRGRHQCMQHFPQRRHAVRGDGVVEVFAGCGGCRQWG